jgi:hypothetical protein
VTRDQPDPSHDTEVLGEVRLFHPEFAGQLAYRPFAIPPGVENAQASGMTDGTTKFSVETVRLFRDIHEVRI